jgi:hypothetical protein
MMKFIGKAATDVSFQAIAEFVPGGFKWATAERKALRENDFWQCPGSKAIVRYKGQRSSKLKKNSTIRNKENYLSKISRLMRSFKASLTVSEVHDRRFRYLFRAPSVGYWLR